MNGWLVSAGFKEAPVDAGKVCSRSGDEDR